MTQLRTRSILVAMMAAIFATSLALPAGAQVVRQADMDFEGSGFVTPAGMISPAEYFGGIQQVGYQSAYGDSYVSPVSYSSSCDCGACDGGCCDATGSCDGSCGGGGLLGKMCCNNGIYDLSCFCIFCRGEGCSACQGRSCLSLAALRCLLPYSEAGLCAQRWYDISVEGLWLSHTNGSQSGLLTTDGVEGRPVLDLNYLDIGDSMQGGVRLSGSMLFGVGSNLELTYMGGHEWEDTAVAYPGDPGAATLYSFISEFGTNPEDGFDDTDRSLAQSIQASTDFHSVEWNYRRRTVSPCCRFQGSCLVGLRYVRFDSRMIYECFGEDNNTVNADLPRFFSSNDKVKNNLFGPQAGFDFWWNVCPGINLGCELKGAWVQNDAKRQTVLTGNSLDTQATPGSVSISNTERFGTLVGELQGTAIYRLSHSCALRSSYHLIAIDDVVFGTIDGELARDFVTVSPLTSSPLRRHSVVLQGISLGMEYMW